MTGGSSLGRWLRRSTAGDTARQDRSGKGNQPGFEARAEALETGQRAASSAALTPGQLFGPYRVEKEVGRGAMAAVYRCTDERDGRIIALKVLSLGDDWPEDRLEEAKLRLQREAEATARIQHPDIVDVYEAGEYDGLVYLTMEFVEGVSLTTHTRQGALLPPRMVTEMCARVADALHFAHQRGIMHRDIKPANIVFDQKNRRIRVMDFGVARFADSQATRTGIVLGSPSYLTPEQLDGRKVVPQSDLFSLGVSLFQLLTGQLPFRADSMPSLMHRIAVEPHPPLRTIRPDLPDSLARIIDIALRKDPDARFASGADMAQALRDCGRTISPSLR